MEVTITDAGRTPLGTREPLPRQGLELIRWWGGQLGKAERLVLEYLATQPGRDVPIEEIADRTGYSATSGGFRNSLSPAFPRPRPTGRGTLRISTHLLARHTRRSAVPAVFASVSVGPDTITTMTTRPRTTTGCRSDAEILTDFVRLLALKTLLDDLHSTHVGGDTDTTHESGSLAGEHEPDGEGQSWRRKSSSN